MAFIPKWLRYRYEEPAKIPLSDRHFSRLHQLKAPCRRCWWCTTPVRLELSSTHISRAGADQNARALVHYEGPLGPYYLCDEACWQAWAEHGRHLKVPPESRCVRGCRTRAGQPALPPWPRIKWGTGNRGTLRPRDWKPSPLLVFPEDDTAPPLPEDETSPPGPGRHTPPTRPNSPEAPRAKRPRQEEVDELDELMDRMIA